MRLRTEILCLALALPSRHAASAFTPPGGRGFGSARAGASRDPAPRDAVSSNAFAPTDAPRWEIRSTLASGEEAIETVSRVEGHPVLPERLETGLYDIKNEEQHNNWLEANPDKIMVIKFYSPYCRACKSVAPRFIQISKDPKYDDIPIIFGQLSLQDNKEYVKSLGIVALPSTLIYAGSEGLVENFPCGPSKIVILKRKIRETIQAKVDPNTMLLKVDCSKPGNEERAPCRADSLALLEELETGQFDEVISDERKEENVRYLRTGVPYFKDFDDDEFFELMDKAKIVTFDQGEIITRQGMEGSSFYVIESGEVEIMVKTAFEDPLSSPSDYLGAVINTFGPHNFFGERALITHEPLAASIRTTQKTRCFVFDVKDIPSSSALSGTKQATAESMAEVNSKYGIEAKDRVISLLVRFNQIRRAARCFEYIRKARPNFGDAGEARRRALLVSKLSRLQHEEFSDLFRFMDLNGDGRISVAELRRAMETAGEARSDEEILEMINTADLDGNREINFTEFMGVMAEAEFYYLFLETFETLDVNNTGFVEARELDRVLCGVRDLISDDRMSIIDTEDMDMQVDYETYADMLLGKPL